jgi:1D-myo-inositol 3-kinase
VNSDLHYDYTTVGHVTVDVLPDGTRRPGGSAFYSALQAARLGLRAAVFTRGRPEQIEALLAPYRDELDLHVQAAPETTTLRTRWQDGERHQQVLAWAGPIGQPTRIDTGILHLAPVARETPAGRPAGAGFLGLTPQGLARAWGADGHVRHEPGAPVLASLALAGASDALVISEQERAGCAELLQAAAGAGAIVAITAGGRPTTILVAGAEALSLPVPAREPPVDELGAGDVFAAAFFIALHEGTPAAAAARFGQAAAAVRVRGTGADAIGTRAQLERELSRPAPARSAARAPLG